MNPSTHHDHDAERSVLGGCLLHAQAVAQVEGILTPEDFDDSRHATIFEAILAVSNRSDPVDAVSLSHELSNRDKLNTVGGTPYLGELMDTVSTAANIETHAKIVADLARVRRAHAFALEAMANARTPEAMAEAAEKIAAAATAGEQRGAIKLEDALQDAFNRYEAHVARGGGLLGLDTGLTDLNTTLSGLEGGRVYLVAARPAAGKTSLVLGLGVSMAKYAKGKVVDFFSLEMPSTELTDRLLCSEARVDSQRLKHCLLSEDDHKAIVKAANKLHPLPFFIHDVSELTIAKLRSHCRKRARSKEGLAGVIIDYVQLMSGMGEENREKEIATISRGLKQIAKELNIPVIALAQMNRQVERRGADARPQKSDLRESGALEQDADCVIFIHPDKEVRGKSTLIVDKNRGGPERDIPVRFVKEFTRFEDWSENDDRYRTTASKQEVPFEDEDENAA